MAPSPTGFLHLGTARTAIFNWLFARHSGGKFIIRIEDTDTERSKKEYEENILEGFKWLGLEWDEGPDVGGKFGPYRQSERLPIYKKYLEKLLSEGRAYYCYCTKEELESERQVMLAQGLPPKYSGHCRNLESAPVGKEAQVIRFKTPSAEVEFKDIIRSKVSFDSGLFGDIVIAKNLDSPLYNFAVVVDDHEMRISHVIRGEDHISNTPKQILFQKALGFETPEYAHLPLILAADRSKLSKRYMETSLLQYRDDGYLPQAMINFMALMGWHEKGDKEIFSAEELIREFDIKRVQKAGAIFNLEKLSWLNREHLRKLQPKEILNYLKPLLQKRNIKPSAEFLSKILAVEQERIKTLKDIFELGDFYFALPPYEPELLVWKDAQAQKMKEVLEEINKIFSEIDEKSYTETDLQNALDALIAKEGRGNILWPLRVALSGKEASPHPLQIAQVLGKKESLTRINTAIKKLSAT